MVVFYIFLIVLVVISLITGVIVTIVEKRSITIDDKKSLEDQHTKVFKMISDNENNTISKQVQPVITAPPVIEAAVNYDNNVAVNPQVVPITNNINPQVVNQSNVQVMPQSVTSNVTYNQTPVVQNNVVSTPATQNYVQPVMQSIPVVQTQNVVQPVMTTVAPTSTIVPTIVNSQPLNNTPVSQVNQNSTVIAVNNNDLNNSVVTQIDTPDVVNVSE